MALIIVRAKEKDGIDFADSKNAANFSRKYDIIDILNDDIYPGDFVCLPEYFVFQVEGQTREDLVHFTEPKLSILVDNFNRTIILKKRKYRFHFDNKINQVDLDDIRNNSKWKLKKISVDDFEEKE